MFNLEEKKKLYTYIKSFENLEILESMVSSNIEKEIIENIKSFLI